jgi:hypothetical protein
MEERGLENEDFEWGGKQIKHRLISGSIRHWIPSLLVTTRNR